MDIINLQKLEEILLAAIIPNQEYTMFELTRLMRIHTNELRVRELVWDLVDRKVLHFTPEWKVIKDIGNNK